MSTACLVAFHEFLPRFPRKRGTVLFDYFAKIFAKWAHHVDHLYIVNSAYGIDQARFDALKDARPELTLTVWNRNGSHWGNMNFAIPQIKEDKLLLTDSDTIIYNPKVVEDIFTQLDTVDIVSMTDNSGGIDLFEKHDFLKANKNRDVRRRLAPYLFACKMKMFERIGKFDFTPLTGDMWTDSMGQITDQMLALYPTVVELPDDRTTLYLIDGEHKPTTFLDSANFEWSKPGPRDYGYYHVRNWSRGVYLVECKQFSRSAYKAQRDIMPPQEMLRLLAWVFVMSDERYQKDILEAVNDIGTSTDDFNLYITAFKQHHAWLNTI